MTGLFHVCHLKSFHQHSIFINQMAYSLNCITSNESLLDHMWYNYPDLSVGIVGYGFDYDNGVGDTVSTK